MAEEEKALKREKSRRVAATSAANSPTGANGLLKG